MVFVPIDHFAQRGQLAEYYYTCAYFVRKRTLICENINIQVLLEMLFIIVRYKIKVVSYLNKNG